jgi:hypothetical protein
MRRAHRIVSEKQVNSQEKEESDSAPHLLVLLLIVFRAILWGRLGWFFALKPTSTWSTPLYTQLSAIIL